MLKLGLEISLSHDTEAFLSCLVHGLIEAFKPQTCPHGPLTTEYTIMSKFLIPDDQPDFDIALEITGKDSEGHAVAVPAGTIVEVDNSNGAAIVGTLKSTTPSEDGLILNAVVGVHVADPSPDLGVIAYKVLGADGTLLGAGSDEFLVGTGAFKVADVKSTVPLTPAV